MVEGAPLLREYRLKRLIEGSNPSLSANKLINTPFISFIFFLPTFKPTNTFAINLIRLTPRTDVPLVNVEIARLNIPVTM